MDKNDLISRSAAIEKFKKLKSEAETLLDALVLEGAMAVLEAIPSVDPEELRPKGHWEWYEEKFRDPIYGVDYDWGYRCSNCAHNLPDDYDDPEYPPEIYYCPNCGAKMTED